jgi:glycerol-3-phosphate acyltransferase PlsY
MLSVAVVLFSYLLGSIPSAYIAGRVFKGIDIRNFGDGNVGAINAGRVLGRTTGIIVMIADVSKGAIAVLIAQAFASQPVILLAGFVVVVGHNWSIYIRFKGGVGQSTTIGVFVALLPHAMGILLAASAISFLITRNRILAGVTQFAPLWLVALLMGSPMVLVVYSIALPCLLGLRYLQTARHRRMMLTRKTAIGDKNGH